ncbi:MAG: HAD family phosphatase [Chloroflexi bacterium]|nr:HAD family phosphatase [Chloroflexota bacterium]
MIRAVLFDLDGTLVQSERLKANSYAQAVQQVLGPAEPDLRAIDAYKEIVGSAREVASRHIMERLDIEDSLRPLMSSHNATEHAQVLTDLRMQLYNDLVADPEVLRSHQWPHNISLLRMSREQGCATGLATMSTRSEALRVLETLEIASLFDVVLGREDVQNAKPDPEIYLKAAALLNTPPGECMVIEDSPAGVQAGLSAGMNVIAVATPFTECGLMGAPGIDPRWIVHDPETLMLTVRKRIEEHQRSEHPTEET